MTVAQMNIRVNETIKAQGDSALADFGLTPTQAVRALWDYLAQHRTLPDFLKQEARTETVSACDASALADQGAGLALRLATDAGLDTLPLQEASYEELRDYAFEEYLAERKIRDV